MTFPNLITLLAAFLLISVSATPMSDAEMKVYSALDHIERAAQQLACSCNPFQKVYVKHFGTLRASNLASIEDGTPQLRPEHQRILSVLEDHVAINDAMGQLGVPVQNMSAIIDLTGSVTHFCQPDAFRYQLGNVSLAPQTAEASSLFSLPDCLQATQNLRHTLFPAYDTSAMRINSTLFEMMQLSQQTTEAHVAEHQDICQSYKFQWWCKIREVSQFAQLRAKRDALLLFNNFPLEVALALRESLLKSQQHLLDRAALEIWEKVLFEYIEGGGLQGGIDGSSEQGSSEDFKEDKDHAKSEQVSGHNPSASWGRISMPHGFGRELREL